MASINYAARQISVKIVYYGPGLSGKTTNLQVIHKKTPQENRSDMVSLATETDRTLFFDFLPLDLGKIKQFDTKFQLYTVPGQVYYNATRKLVLRGVDGVVFVADSGADKIQENLESFQNLEDNLAEYGYQRDSIPIILQYNKRDLPNALPIEELQRHINKYNLPYSEGIAYKGVGVFDTLKQIGKIVIDHLNKKYSRSAGGRAAAPAPAAPAVPPQGGYQQPAYAPPQPQYAPPQPQAYQQPAYAPPQQQYAPPPQAPAWEQPQYANQGYQQPAPQPQAYRQPMGAPQAYAPPQQQYAPPQPQASAWEAPAMPSASADPFLAAPAAQGGMPSFDVGPVSAPPADPFLAAPAAQGMPSFDVGPVSAPPAVDPFSAAPAAQGMPSFDIGPMAAPQAAADPFLAAPAAQGMPSFDVGPAPAPAPQQSFDYDDVFMIDPAPPAAPAQGMPQANQPGGYSQSPFEFEAAPPPPPQAGGAQMSGGGEFDLESFSKPAAAAVPPAPAPSNISFDYQPFTPPPAQAAPITGFGAPVQAPAGGYRTSDPFAPLESYAPQITAAAPQGGGRSELDLEIEKYQREIEEKQKGLHPGATREMQPYPGQSDHNRYQSPFQQAAPAAPPPPPQRQQSAPGTGSPLCEFEAELAGMTEKKDSFNAQEEYPSDSAMFFTTVDRNTAMLKKSGKPPVVNPAKAKAQQQQHTKSFMMKFFNKDQQG